MDKAAFEKHNKLAKEDFILSCNLEKARSLSDSQLNIEKENSRSTYLNLKREDYSWYSLPSFINYASVPAYLFSLVSIIEFLLYGNFKYYSLYIFVFISILYCVFHFFWLKNRKQKLSFHLKNMRAIDAVLIERGDKVAVMMKDVGPNDL